MDTAADLMNDALNDSNIPALKSLAYPDDAIPQSGEAVKIKKCSNVCALALTAN
jgi:hypothetical protein